MLVGGIALNFGDAGLELPRRQRTRLRHRRRRIRQRVLRQDGEVPEVPARHRRHQQHRVRSRRHLRRSRRRARWRSVGSCNLVPRNGLLLLGADSPDAAALVADGRQSGRDLRPGRGCDVAGASTIEHRDGLTRFDVRRDGQPFGRFESPLLGVHNVRNALAAIAVGARVGLDAGDAGRRAAAVQGHQAPARDRRRRARRHGARRLRAPSDGGPRDAVGAAHRLSRPAHLGGVRAAIGLVVPARVSGRLCQGVRRGGRSRSRRGVSLVAARSGAAVGRAAGRRSLRARAGMPGTYPRSTTSSRRSSANAATATSSC